MLPARTLLVMMTSCLWLTSGGCADRPPAPVPPVQPPPVAPASSAPAPSDSAALQALVNEAEHVDLKILGAFRDAGVTSPSSRSGH
jgi:hypothetical protein